MKGKKKELKSVKIGVDHFNKALFNCSLANGRIANPNDFTLSRLMFAFINASKIVTDIFIEFKALQQLVSLLLYDR
jgi:hypothetical protein